MGKNSGRRGFFRNAINAMIEARQREADRHLGSVLLSLDDETLAAYGYDRAELKRRAGSAFIY